MDRDKRWERTELALDAIVDGAGATARDAVEAIRASYDERRHRRVHRADRRSAAGRGSMPRRTPAIFFNFRPDRARQLSETARVERGSRPDDDDASTREELDFPVAFPEQSSR